MTTPFKTMLQIVDEMRKERIEKFEGQSISLNEFESMKGTLMKRVSDDEGLHSIVHDAADAMLTAMMMSTKGDPSIQQADKITVLQFLQKILDDKGAFKAFELMFVDVIITWEEATERFNKQLPKVRPE